MRQSIIILIVMLLAVSAYMLRGLLFVAPETVRMEQYHSDETHISFLYPDVYKIEERLDGLQNAQVRILNLTDKRIAAGSFDVSEGPPLISIITVDVSSTTVLADWLATSSISNFYLSQDNQLKPTTVGGEAALSYTHTGLYESDATAALHAGRVYIFSSSWLSAEDTIRKDFQTILSSVTFSQ